MSNGHTPGRWALVAALIALALAVYANVVLHHGDDVWLNSECNGQLVGDILSEIATKANSAMGGPNPPTPAEYDQLMAVIVKCALNTPAFPGGEAAHCQQLQNALADANANDWAGCIADLDMGH